MKAASLTAIRRGATNVPMNGMVNGSRTGLWRVWVLALIAILAGCISVEAPDGPIVIELNINIKSEVLVALADDSVDAIEENADIF